ncbi:hypothetical protein AB0L80_40335 [Streptomyces sp. NPDC052069]|uniref:hypothetical protein n=1 Tax=Streptomyces sp. NPDC052069 TaxID=3154650 RepID=UPI003439B360
MPRSSLDLDVVRTLVKPPACSGGGSIAASSKGSNRATGRSILPSCAREFFGDDGEAGYVPVGRSGEVEVPGPFDAAEFVDAVPQLWRTTRAARSWSQVGDTGSMNPAMTWTWSPRMCWTAHLRARSESSPSWL